MVEQFQDPKILLSKLRDNQKQFDQVMKGRYFYWQSNEIHNPPAGFYDFGPTGTQILNNLLQVWKDMFILEEDLLQISTSNLTNEQVFITSGHVEKFNDIVVKDLTTTKMVRADHLIEEYINQILSNKKKADKLSPEQKQEFQQILAQAGGMDIARINEIIKKYQITNVMDANCQKNQVSEAFYQNQMFSTNASGNVKLYLRPETAQNIYVNFNKLLDFNQGKVPFGAAIIGLGFRNEVSPRNQLLRVREFNLAEIQYFYDVKDLSHKKFKDVQDIQVRLLSACQQLEGKEDLHITTIGQSVQDSIVKHEIYGYFMGRIFEFLTFIGINKEYIRFRQHLSGEMAHYASDCWDAEILTSYGWIECVGMASRGCFDLKVHSEKTKIELMASRKLKEPKEVTIIKMDIIKKELAKDLKQMTKKVCDYLESLDENGKAELQTKLEQEGQVEYEGAIVKSQYVKFQKITKNVIEEKFYPNVIEPSFGINRIFYALLEQTFRIREDKRNYMIFPPRVAPIKVTILPLINNEEFLNKVQQIKKQLTRMNISSKVDDGKASIGKRYSRTDELGIPFGITVDNDTIDKDLVTIREISTMKQIQLQLIEAFDVIQNLSNQTESWSNYLKKYPEFGSSNQE